MTVRFDPKRAGPPPKHETPPGAQTRPSHYPLPTRLQTQLREVKCIVVDLDNTLWGGMVGEVGRDGIALDGPEGQVFVERQRQLLDLKNRGYLLAIASKNNEEVVLDVLRNHPAMVLREKDFVAILADWNPKSANLRQLTEDLNLPASSFLFLDDTERERGMMREGVPEAVVVEPAEFLFSLKFLADQAQQVTEIDLQRTELYSARRMRKKTLAAAPDVKNLGIQITMREITEGDFVRASQITQRTNQFNSRGVRYSESELRGKMVERDTIILTIRYSDKFGDDGMVGLVIARVDSDCLGYGEFLQVEDFYLSCRVLGFGVEQAVAAAMLELPYRDRTSGFECLDFLFEPTERNGLYREFFERYLYEGSWRTKNRRALNHYAMSIQAPDGIKVVVDERLGRTKELIQLTGGRLAALVSNSGVAQKAIPSTEQSEIEALMQRRKSTLKLLENIPPLTVREYHDIICNGGIAFVDDFVDNYLRYARDLIEIDHQLLEHGITAHLPLFLKGSIIESASDYAYYPALALVCEAWRETHPQILLPSFFETIFRNSRQPKDIPALHSFSKVIRSGHPFTLLKLLSANSTNWKILTGFALEMPDVRDISWSEVLRRYNLLVEQDIDGNGWSSDSAHQISPYLAHKHGIFPGNLDRLISTEFHAPQGVRQYVDLALALQDKVSGLVIRANKTIRVRVSNEPVFDWAGNLRLTSVEARRLEGMIELELALAPNRNLADWEEHVRDFQGRFQAYVRYSADNGYWSGFNTLPGNPNYDLAVTVNELLFNGDRDGNVILKGSFQLPYFHHQFEFTVYLLDRLSGRELWRAAYDQGNVIISR